MKIESDGTQIRGYQSTDGTTWTLVGRPADLPTGNDPGRHVLARQRRGHRGHVGVRLVHADDPRWRAAAVPVTSSTARAWTRRAGTRSSARTPRSTSVGERRPDPDHGRRPRSTARRQQRTTSSRPPITPRRTEVLETKLSAWTLAGPFSQAGILAWQDDNNYVKFNAISDNNNTRINRLENRSKVGRHGHPKPQPQIERPRGHDRHLAAPDEGRAPPTRASTRSTGRPGPSVGGRSPTRMVAPKFGLYTAGVRRRRARPSTFDYFKVNGSTGCSGGDEHAAGDHVRHGDAHSGFAPLAVALERRRHRRQRRRAHVLVGLRRQRHGGRDGRHGVHHVHHRRQQDRQAHGERRQGRHRHAGHPGQVLAADNPAAKLRALVFSKTAGFRHDAIPAGIAAVQSLGHAEELAGRHHRGRVAVHGRGPRRTTTS